MKLNVKEPVSFRLKQTGELVKYKETGIIEIENDLKAERIMQQSGGKIEIFKTKKGKNNG